MGFCWKLDFIKWFGIRVVIRGFGSNRESSTHGLDIDSSRGLVFLLFLSRGLALGILDLVNILVRLL